MSAAVAATTMEVPESQRLIAVSLGKIAASRGQKGGINLHKNLLVATVLHKARTAYMIQHFARQRAAQGSPAPTTTATESVEMKEEPSNGSQPLSSSPSPSSPASASVTAAAAPTFPTAAPRGASVAPTPETGSAPGGAAVVADVSPVQVAECDDKENTPPPTPPPHSGDAIPSAACEKRLQGEDDKGDTVRDLKEKNHHPSPYSAASRSPMSHARQSRRDYVSNQSCSSCVLKRRRTMDRDNENVSAPKVRILESRSSSQDSSPEPMQCDSPQISNLVNIFNTSFSGLSGAAAAAAAAAAASGSGDVSVRSVGQSILTSVSSHKMPENLTCAKEMKVGLDSVHQPLVLSV